MPGLGGGPWGLGAGLGAGGHIPLGPGDVPCLINLFFSVLLK